jgi:hypothetical protein
MHQEILGVDYTLVDDLGTILVTNSDSVFTNLNIEIILSQP